MPSYTMTCTHCGYEVIFHGVKVTPSEGAPIRGAEKATR